MPELTTICRASLNTEHSTLTLTGSSEKLSTKTKHIPALLRSKQVDSTKNENENEIYLHPNKTGMSSVLVENFSELAANVKELWVMIAC